MRHSERVIVGGLEVLTQWDLGEESALAFWKHRFKSTEGKKKVLIEPWSILLPHPRNVSQGSALQSLAQRDLGKMQSLCKHRDFCTRAVHQSKGLAEGKRQQSKQSFQGFTCKNCISKGFSASTFASVLCYRKHFHATSYLFAAVHCFCLPSWEW